MLLQLLATPGNISQPLISGGAKYSMATVVNKTVLYIWKLLRERILEILITREKSNCVEMDVSWTYYGDHFHIFTNIKSLDCTPEANMISSLYLNF